MTCSFKVGQENLKFLRRGVNLNDALETFIALYRTGYKRQQESCHRNCIL